MRSFNDRNRGKSTVRTRSELTNNGYIGADLVASEEIDILAAMQAGTKMLKLLARRKGSHWRKFQLDATNRSVYWESHKKDALDTTIQIANIVDIICYDKNVLTMFRDTLPEDLYNDSSDDMLRLQQQQFTIRYKEANKSKYLPQLSPNHSLTFHNTQNSHPIVNGHVLHQAKNSNSFIRSLRTSQHQRTDSVTDSGSNDVHNHHNNNNNTASNTRSGSFFKLKKFAKSGTKEQTPDLQEAGNVHHTHERNHTDSSRINQFTVHSKDYHVQELHLMAKNEKIANIWIYGLEHLVAACRNGVDLSLISLQSEHYAQFRISSKQLRNYAFQKGREQNQPFLTAEEEAMVLPFTQQLDRVGRALYAIIKQVPESYQAYLEDKAAKRSLHMNAENSKKKKISLDNMIEKLKQDQNDLDRIQRDWYSGSRFNILMIKNWSFTLTRIEINLGGYQLALSSKRYALQTSHKRERSLSNNFVGNTRLIQQSYSNHVKSNYRSQMLKNRSPREPNSPFSENNLHRLDDSMLLTSPKRLERYDSV